MREIKFRGRLVHGGWWIGDLITDSHKEKTYIHNRISGVPNFNGDFMASYIVMCEVISETVGQFTGLKDKNGVEIFEGDVVKCRDSYDEDYYESTITFKECSFCIDVVGCDYDFTSLGWALDNNDISGGDIEVIGNIHEVTP